MASRNGKRLPVVRMRENAYRKQLKHTVAYHFSLFYILVIPSPSTYIDRNINKQK